MASVLAKIFAILDQFRVLLVFAARSIVAAVKFLWAAITWLFDIATAFPLFSSILILAVALGFVLFVIGR